MLYRVTDVTFDDIINDFGTYVDLLLEHKVVGFAAPLYLDMHQNSTILRLMFDHGMCRSAPVGNSVGIWTNNTGLNHHPSTSLKDGDDPLQLVTRNYHADTVECRRPESIITMSMHTYSKTVYGNRPGYEDLAKWEGETLYFDMEDLYEKCPFKDYLETLNLKHPPLPGNEVQIHPALRTHPVTGKTALCLSNANCVPEGYEFNTVPRYDGEERTWNENTKEMDYYQDGDLPQEFMEYIAWFKDELPKEENRNWWHWEEGNFIIWDNRNTYHSFSGYQFGPTRVFDKGMCGSDGVWYGEKPQALIDEEIEALQNLAPDMGFGHVAWVSEIESNVEGDEHASTANGLDEPHTFSDGHKMIHSIARKQVPFQASPIHATYDL
jgi:hypothetical protein